MLARFGQAWGMTSSASTRSVLSAPAVGPVRLADALGWGSSVLGAPMLLERIAREGDLFAVPAQRLAL